MTTKQLGQISDTFDLFRWKNCDRMACHTRTWLSPDFRSITETTELRNGFQFRRRCFATFVTSSAIKFLSRELIESDLNQPEALPATKSSFFTMKSSITFLLKFWKVYSWSHNLSCVLNCAVAPKVTFIRNFRRFLLIEKYARGKGIWWRCQYKRKWAVQRCRNLNRNNSPENFYCYGIKQIDHIFPRSTLFFTMKQCWAPAMILRHKMF